MGFPVDWVWQWLQGHVFSTLLHIRGIFNIHASSVVLNGRAIALSGDTHAGKSTLALSFLSKGWQLLTDDLLPLSLDGGSGTISALPSYPVMRLFEDVSGLFFADKNQFPNAALGWSKLRVPSSKLATVFRDKAALLVAFFKIRRLEESAEFSAGEAVRFSRLSGSVAIREVLGAAITLPCLNRRLQAKYFRSCGAIASSIPVVELQILPGLDHLPGICDAISDWVSRPSIDSHDVQFSDGSVVGTVLPN